MNSKVRYLNLALKRFDKTLYAKMVPGGLIQIYRQTDRLKACQMNQAEEMDPYYSQPQLVLNLTEDWSYRGRPADWGIEPVLQQLRSMDRWNDDDCYHSMLKSRDREKDLRENRRKSEFRARAADMRSDFARATNDINTSTLEKVDRRRSYGYC